MGLIFRSITIPPSAAVASCGREVEDAPGNTAPAESDYDLLDRYIETNSSDAFSQIVQRHSGWVYHLCRRNLGDAHLAEDAAQAVFLLLSRKALSTKPETHLAGWLFQAARYVLADLRKNQARYRRRQEVARQMTLRRFADYEDAAEAEPNPELSAALDEAIAGLRDSDRQTILMHFYEGLTLCQMAEHLGLSKEGAKKRVTRALARLRAQMESRLKGANRGRGVTVSLLALSVLLRARGAEAAPVELITTVGKAAITPGLSSLVAEMLAAGVRQAAMRATDRLLATLAGMAIPMALMVASSVVVWRQGGSGGAVRQMVPRPGRQLVMRSAPPVAETKQVKSAAAAPSLTPWELGPVQPCPATHSDEPAEPKRAAARRVQEESGAKTEPSESPTKGDSSGHFTAAPLAGGGIVAITVAAPSVVRAPEGLSGARSFATATPGGVATAVPAKAVEPAGAVENKHPADPPASERPHWPGWLPHDEHCGPGPDRLATRPLPWWDATGGGEMEPPPALPHEGYQWPAPPVRPLVWRRGPGMELVVIGLADGRREGMPFDSERPAISVADDWRSGSSGRVMQMTALPGPGDSMGPEHRWDFMVHRARMDQTQADGTLPRDALMAALDRPASPPFLGGMNAFALGDAFGPGMGGLAEGYELNRPLAMTFVHHEMAFAPWSRVDSAVTVPEPSTAVTVLTLMGLLGLRRRR